MKKIYLVILLILACNLAKAQFYIQPQGGYMFSLSPELIILKNSNNTIEFNHGQGTAFNLGFGYEISNNFLLELNGNFQFKNTSEWHFEKDTHQLQYIYSPSDFIGDISYQGKSQSISFLVGYTIKTNDFNFSLKAGPNVLFSSFEIHNSFLYPKPHLMLFGYSTKYYSNYITNKKSLGLSSNLNIAYNINTVTSIIFSLISNFNNPEIKSEEETQPSYDGDYMMIETENSEPTPLEVQEFNYSRIGLVIGVKLNL